MTLATKYTPKEVEDKWYQYWLQHKIFESKPNPDKEPYTIVIPPPNVTGVLHMGHMLNNTIQDILIRKARMQGKEACWVPGTDHASIATENKVIQMLQEKGISKKDLTREEFLKYAWEWKEKYGGIILEQLKKLGCSCDWSRTRFTMEDTLSEAVIDVFIDLHKKGHIYRGVKMINWDPKGRTALSDEEVLHKEVNSKLYYVKYAIQDSNEFVTIATTRPETILGDTAICVHPDDPRYQHLVGKKAIVPFVNRAIPIIADEYITMEFGTGCLKVTPAHDINDYNLGLKHQLEIIDVLNDDGTLSKAAQFYVGEDRFVARKKIAKDLEQLGLMVKIEDIKNNLGYSERTNEVIEPRLSAQWFINMQELVKPALENVMNDSIQFHPPKFKNIYRVWMENIRDWCISRQLWWGQQIPAYYLPNGEFVVAKTKEEALKIAQQKDAKLTIHDLNQDEDVLDTWFSSWLWPISVFDGFKDPQNEDINYYYPTNDLVTGSDIIFFWVARMIMAGYEFRQEKPFQNVYFTGMVRDKEGRKMSKQLGNSPDPLTLIEQYGADGVRTGMLFSAPAGNDLLFDEKLCEQGRNFCNKLWNAFRLVKGWQVANVPQPEGNKLAIAWFEAKLNQTLEEIELSFNQYRISESLLAAYKLTWDYFCAWYLEMIKPTAGSIDKITYEATIGFFETVLKMLHPYMPFITEELWHNLNEDKEGKSICIATFPVANHFEQKVITELEDVFELITQIRNIRNAKQIAPKVKLALSIKTSQKDFYTKFAEIIIKMGNLESVSFTEQKETQAVSFVLKGDELYLHIGEEIDTEAEKERILKEIAYTKGFLATIEKKLSNEKFVQNAPEAVLELERKKQADAEAKIKALEESIQSLLPSN